jgi:large subunit ribosomal protein L10
MRRAVGAKLTPELEAMLGGPTAIAFANDDPVACAKAVLDFIRESRRTDIVVRGGYMGGELLSPDQVTALSKIPPRPVVLGQTVGILQAPLSGFAGTMNGVLSEFVRTLQAVADKLEAAA